MYSQTYGWAKDIYAYLGYEGGARNSETEAYGEAHGNYFGSWTGWVQNGDWDNDLGYVRLNRAVGMLTGWFGWAYGYSCTSHYFNNASYPAEDCGQTGLHNGQDMNFWSGTFDACPNNQMQLNTSGGCFDAVWGGMSGSGAYYIDGDSRYVQGVCSTSNRTTRGYYCEQFQSWVEYGNNTFLPDARTSTFDLQALHMQVIDTTIKAGTKTTGLKHLATNPTNANPASKTYDYKVYLSTNSIISTADTLLSSQYVTVDFGEMSSTTINMVNVTIPTSTPAGDYWLGVIYDSSTDGNSGNNDTSGWDAVKISVTACTPPYIPSSITYSATDCDGNFTVTWSTVSNATSYTLQRATNASFSGAITVYSGSSTSYAQSGLSVGTYYYRVKAVNTCDDSSWRTGGAIDILELITQAPANINYPERDDDGVFFMWWSSVSGATGYELWRYDYSTMTWTPLSHSGIWPYYYEAALARGKYSYAAAAKNECGTGSYVFGHDIKIGKSNLFLLLNAVLSHQANSD